MMMTLLIFKDEDFHSLKALYELYEIFTLILGHILLMSS